MQQGVEYSRSVPPYCVSFESHFSKMALLKDGFQAKNLAGKSNTIRQLVQVKVGNESVAQTMVLQKRDNLYLPGHNVISGEPTSVVYLEGKLYVASPIFYDSRTKCSIVQLARPTLFFSEYIHHAQQLSSQPADQKKLAELVTATIIEYLRQ